MAVSFSTLKSLVTAAKGVISRANDLCCDADEATQYMKLFTRQLCSLETVLEELEHDDILKAPRTLKVVESLEDVLTQCKTDAEEFAESGVAFRAIGAKSWKQKMRTYQQTLSGYLMELQLLQQHHGRLATEKALTSNQNEIMERLCRIEMSANFTGEHPLGFCEGDVFPDLQSPGNPTVINLSSSMTKVHVKWSPPRSPHSGLLYEVKILDIAANRLVDKARTAECALTICDRLDPDSNYSFSVRSVSSQGCYSKWTESIHHRTLPLPLPKQPVVTVRSLRSKSTMSYILK